MKYYLGIDGGGTKTTAAVSDENGNVITKATGKTINFYAVGMEASRKNLKEVIDILAQKLATDCFEAAFIGCSALDNEADEATLNALCGGIIKAEKVAMNSDVYVALKSSNGNCVAVCGTGSMAVEFSKMGYEVIATDASADMLMEAQTKAYDNEQSIMFLCQRMEETDLYGTVRAVVCALDRCSWL